MLGSDSQHYQARNTAGLSHREALGAIGVGVGDILASGVYYGLYLINVDRVIAPGLVISVMKMKMLNILFIPSVAVALREPRNHG